MIHTYTEEQKEFLTKNFKHMSSYVLTERLNAKFKIDVSRSSVMGVLHRMGIKKNENAGHYNASKKQAKEPVQKTVITHTKTLGEAGNNDCRFTTDEPKKGADMGICGRAVFKSGVCKTCYPVVFRKVELNEHETNND